MKKFHKRAAVFLTAATLAGLPAGAFFYSSPGSLTVWADNVEVESSEESNPFFSFSQKLKFLQIQWNRHRKMQEMM